MFCHMTGEDDDILVMSLNPPAAIFLISPSGESLSLTRLTREADITWGTWLTAAVMKSCCP